MAQGRRGWNMQRHAYDCNCPPLRGTDSQEPFWGVPIIRLRAVVSSLQSGDIGVDEKLA